MKTTGGEIRSVLSRSKRRNLLKRRRLNLDSSIAVHRSNEFPPTMLSGVCVYFGERWYRKHTKKLLPSHSWSHENQSLCSICCLFASLFAKRGLRRQPAKLACSPGNINIPPLMTSASSGNAINKPSSLFRGVGHFSAVPRKIIMEADRKSGI